MDKFTIEAVDLGQVFKIRIRHDNTMVGADWYLDQVEVQDMETEEVYMFLCERWLSKKKEDKQIDRIFYVKVCFIIHYFYKQDKLSMQFRVAHVLSTTKQSRFSFCDQLIIF